jgi:hypothetical protein
MSSATVAPSAHSAWNNQWGPGIPTSIRRQAERAGVPFVQLVRLFEIYLEENPAEPPPATFDELVARVLL